MKRALTLMCLVLMCLDVVGAQEMKPVANLSIDGSFVEIQYTSGEPLPERFVPEAGDLNRYRLVELEPADQPGLVTSDRTGWLDAARAPECAGLNCTVLRVWLRRHLPPSQTFILAISSFTNNRRAITLRFTTPAPATPPAAPPLAQITSGPDVYKQNSQLQLVAKEDVAVQQPTVQVHRLYYEISSDGITAAKKSDIFVAKVQRLTNRRYVLTLDGKLVAGKEHTFFIEDGITNSVGQEVRAEGSVKVTGIPTKADEIRIETNWAAVAAVHQKPVFEMNGKYNPIRIEQIRGTEWLWEPTVNVDVGLRSTKSANSVVIAPLNFSNVFGEELSIFRRGRHKAPPPALVKPGAKPETGDRTYNYADWLSTPLFRPSNVKFTFGPKAEFDRNFKRKNIIGSVRFDLNFHRGQALISDKRALIEDDFGKEAATTARLKYGLKITPYLSF